MDVEAVYEAGRKAVQWARDGKGPYILEMKTYRYRGHSMSDPAKYRTREEVQQMREKHDPIDTFGARLVRNAGLLREDDLKIFDREVRQVNQPRGEFATDSPEPAQRKPVYGHCEIAGDDAYPDARALPDYGGGQAR